MTQQDFFSKWGFFLQDLALTAWPRITRVEVIDENGRSYVNRNDNNKVNVQIQDDGQTLKIFISQ